MHTFLDKPFFIPVSIWLSLSGGCRSAHPLIKQRSRTHGQARTPAFFKAYDQSQLVAVCVPLGGVSSDTWSFAGCQGGVKLVQITSTMDIGPILM